MLSATSLHSVALYRPKEKKIKLYMVENLNCLHYIDALKLPQHICSFFFVWLGRKPEGEKMESKDWKAFEKAVNEQDTEKFYNLMRYWRRIGEEFAYNDTYTEIHLLREMPYRDIHAESAEFLKILAELKIEYDNPDIYGKASEMLVQAIADGDESKIKQLSRFIYLLGVRESTKHITKRVDECLGVIHEKYGDSLTEVVELQEKLGFIPMKENEDNEK